MHRLDVLKYFFSIIKPLVVVSLQFRNHPPFLYFHGQTDDAQYKIAYTAPRVRRDR